jgi:hypothetical protein
MMDLVAVLDGDQKFVLAIILIACLTGVLGLLAAILPSLWYYLRHAQIEADLKRDMLDRGMSAEEIEQVIEATPRSGWDLWWSERCKKRG